MTLSPGDRVRLCKHPENVPYRLPARLPVTEHGPDGGGMRIRMADTTRPMHGPWPILHRCVDCGIVGELAEEGT